MPHSSKNNSSETIKYKVVHNFPNDINTKMNVIAQIEFELVYYELLVRYVCQNAMRNPPRKSVG